MAPLWVPACPQQHDARPETEGFVGFRVMCTSLRCNDKPLWSTFGTFVSSLWDVKDMVIQHRSWTVAL